MDTVRAGGGGVNVSAFKRLTCAESRQYSGGWREGGVNVSAFKRLTYSESRQYLQTWRERQCLQTSYILVAKRQYVQTTWGGGVNV